MSTLKVDTINTTDGSGNITFSRPTVLQAGDIVEADLADDAVTIAKLAATGTASSSTFLRGDNAWAAAGGGKVLQVVNTSNGDVVSGTTTIPNDDTIPQITEGHQFLSLAITPASTSNKLVVMVEWNGVNSTAASQLLGCLFNTDVHATNSQANSYCSLGGNTGTKKFSAINMTYHLSAPTGGSATTFLFRVGAHQASTTYMSAGLGVTTRRFGGVTNSSMTIWELSA